MQKPPRIEVRPPIAQDFLDIDLDPLGDTDNPSPEDAAIIAGRCDLYARTILVDGVVKGIAGIYWTGEAWSFLARDSARGFVAAVRHVRKALDAHTLHVGEVWATIDPEHPAGARWARAIGLEQRTETIWVRPARPHPSLRWDGYNQE